ncbi:MAG: hypothetical protein KA974_11670 [Saprospiraceae bacterium]|nr:hypothetical protein [Saprospiraceae bacterium]
MTQPETSTNDNSFVYAGATITPNIDTLRCQANKLLVEYLGTNGIGTRFPKVKDENPELNYEKILNFERDSSGKKTTYPNDFYPTKGKEGSTCGCLISWYLWRLGCINKVKYYKKDTSLANRTDKK